MPQPNKIKHVLITGSSRGIGLCTAKEFFNAGANVLLNCASSADIMQSQTDALNKSARLGNKAACFSADVSDYEQCQKMVEYAVKEFGSIDVLVNNAAISAVGLFTDMPPREYERIIHLNLISVMHMSHLVLPYMIKNGSGCVINISSVWGDKGASCEAVYAASKAGVNAFTKSLAKELGPAGIRVNAISCGVINTDMNAWLNDEEKADLFNQIGLNRFGEPAEIARTALFLASADASYITGAVINADGGM